MSAFQYKAINNNGRTVLGRIDANNDADLELRLHRMGLELISSKPARESKLRFGKGKVGRPELITFCFHLEQLTRAGVPLMEGLTDLRDTLDNVAFREVVSTLIEDIQGGKTMSEALARFPKIFDRIFISLIRAGEKSGMLSNVLKELADGLKWQDELASQTKKIIMYPAFVGTVVLGVVFFLMIKVVPELVAFVQNMGHEMPFHTRMLLAVSTFCINYWYLIVITPPLLIFGVKYAAKTKPSVRFWNR